MKYQSDWIQWDSQRNKHVHVWSDGSADRGDSATAAKATICIVHGLGEHGGRYENLARDFVAAGFRVLAYDQQGHGLSSEQRGCIASYDSLLNDIGAFLSWTNETYAQPIILFGHSMGGNLVLNYALRRQPLPVAVISSSPMIEAVRKPGKLFRVFARMLMRVAPNYRLQSEIIPERLMSDPLEQQALRDDALFHSQLSLRLGAALLDSGDWVLSNAQRLSVPTLLTHGTRDHLTCPNASEAFASAAGEKCHLRILDDMLHDPFRGLERDAIIRLFIDFADQFSGETSR